MGTFEPEDWALLGEAYAFLGNSLLRPLNQTPTIGLNPEFWEGFPVFDDAAVSAAVAGCLRYAQSASRLKASQAVELAAVEYTHLFVGPPSPAAPPWETLYRAEGVTVGFGEATFDMKRRLREVGLELQNENNQYEDHLGIELLFLSELCRRRVSGAEAHRETAREEAGGGATAAPVVDDAAILRYLHDRPSSWIEAFLSRVAGERPGGYYANLLALVQALLSLQSGRLSG